MRAVHGASHFTGQESLVFLTEHGDQFARAPRERLDAVDGDDGLVIASGAHLLAALRAAGAHPRGAEELAPVAATLLSALVDRAARDPADGVTASYLTRKAGPTSIRTPDAWPPVPGLAGAALTAGLGTEWEILQNGFKYYPSILASHSPIQATLAIVAKHKPDPKRIVSITNETYDTVKSHFSNKDVTTLMGARVSVPYCIAAAAVDGELTQRQFAAGRVHDALIRQVLARTEVVPDAELNKLYPAKFPARVTITLDDGTKLTETVLLPKGDPGAPLSDDELEAKYRDNAEPLLGKAGAMALRDAIWRLDDAPDVAALVRAMIPG